MKLGGVLIALGALLTAFVLGPVRLLESGTLPNVTSSYMLMMWVRRLSPSHPSSTNGPAA